MCGARKGEGKASVREKGRGEKHTSRSKDFCVLLRANKPESIFIKKNERKEERKKRKRKKENVDSLYRKQCNFNVVSGILNPPAIGLDP